MRLRIRSILLASSLLLSIHPIWGLGTMVGYVFSGTMEPAFGAGIGSFLIVFLATFSLIFQRSQALRWCIALFCTGALVTRIADHMNGRTLLFGGGGGWKGTLGAGSWIHPHDSNPWLIAASIGVIVAWGIVLEGLLHRGPLSGMK